MVTGIKFLAVVSTTYFIPSCSSSKYFVSSSFRFFQTAISMSTGFGIIILSARKPDFFELFPPPPMPFKSDHIEFGLSRIIYRES